MPRSCALLLLCTLGIAEARGDEPASKPKADAVASALCARSSARGRPWPSRKEYASSLVPRMPEVKTVAEWEAYADEHPRRGLPPRDLPGRGRRLARRQDPGRVARDDRRAAPATGSRSSATRPSPASGFPRCSTSPRTLEGKVPVVLNVNGHDAKGKAADYKQIRCINQAKRGMIALNLEWFGMGQLRTPGFGHDLINQIDLCGTSGIATHLPRHDARDRHPARARARRPAPGGRDGPLRRRLADDLHQRARPARDADQPGGRLFQLPHAGETMPRTSATPSRRPCDLATVTDYAHHDRDDGPSADPADLQRQGQLLLRRRPRPAAAARRRRADLPPLRQGRRTCARTSTTTPARTTTCLDNRQALYRMLGDHFFTGDSAFDPKEIPSDTEVKTADQLERPPAAPTTRASTAWHLSLSKAPPARRRVAEGSRRRPFVGRRPPHPPP